jgi:hypothetical protein
MTKVVKLYTFKTVHIFYIKNLNIFILRPSRLQRKSAAPKDNFKHFKTVHLVTFFYFVSHPDPADKNKADPCRSMQIRFHNIDSLKSITTAKTMKTDMA